MLPQALPDPRRRKARGDRVHRGGLRPQKAPLRHRLPGAGAGHGFVLRADQAGRRGASHGRVIPRASVSENLTQVSAPLQTPSMLVARHPRRWFSDSSIVADCPTHVAQKASSMRGLSMSGSRASRRIGSYCLTTHADVPALPVNASHSERFD